MRLVPLNPETERIARRVVWFEPPAEALADPFKRVQTKSTRDWLNAIWLSSVPINRAPCGTNRVRPVAES